MTNNLALTDNNDLISDQYAMLATDPGSLARNPAAVYLASLANGQGQRVQKQALGVLTDLLAPGVFIPPAKPKAPGAKATEAEKQAYQQAKADYRTDQEAYKNRCLTVNWAALRFAHTTAIRAQLEGAHSLATANRVLCALRGVLKMAWRLGLMTAEDYQKAADVESLTGSTLPGGRALSGGELSALMTSCEHDTTPAGPRDAALIACMYPGGLRRSEVAAIDLSDYDSETGALTVRHGKGKKDRITYLNLSNGAGKALYDWLMIRGRVPGPLFYPINKGGVLVVKRMTDQAIYGALSKRGELAKLSHFSPHDLRRTFISDLLDSGVDIATVAKLAGHASVDTTARYDRRPEAAKAKAAGKLHLPYKGRMV